MYFAFHTHRVFLTRVDRGLSCQHVWCSKRHGTWWRYLCILFCDII